MSHGSRDDGSGNKKKKKKGEDRSTVEDLGFHEPLDGACREGAGESKQYSEASRPRGSWATEYKGSETWSVRVPLFLPLHEILGLSQVPALGEKKRRENRDQQGVSHTVRGSGVF